MEPPREHLWRLALRGDRCCECLLGRGCVGGQVDRRHFETLGILIETRHLPIRWQQFLETQVRQGEEIADRVFVLASRQTAHARTAVLCDVGRIGLEELLIQPGRRRLSVGGRGLCGIRWRHLPALKPIMNLFKPLSQLLA